MTILPAGCIRYGKSTQENRIGTMWMGLTHTLSSLQYLKDCTKTPVSLLWKHQLWLSCGNDFVFISQWNVNKVKKPRKCEKHVASSINNSPVLTGWVALFGGDCSFHEKKWKVNIFLGNFKQFWKLDTTITLSYPFHDLGRRLVNPEKTQKCGVKVHS